MIEIVTCQPIRTGLRRIHIPKDGERVFYPHPTLITLGTQIHEYAAKLGRLVLYEKERDVCNWMVQTFGEPSLVLADNPSKSYLGPDSIYSTHAKWMFAEDAKILFLRDDPTLMRFKLRWC